MFCDGIGEEFPDIANASRPIKAGELAQCEQHGITGITELKIGYDGIVIANSIDGERYPLSRKTLFLALARQVPVKGKLVDNPYRSWHEIDSALPDTPIEVYGPPPAEGTRDAFVEMVMEEGCKQVPEFKSAYPVDAQRKQQCGTMREDGRFVELLGGNVMVQKLVNNHSALGIFSYSFLDQNRSLVKANMVEGILPTVDNIVNQKYSVARSLFIYVKQQHIPDIKGLAEFARFMTSSAAIGDDGFLSVKGLIPMSPAEQAVMQKRAEAL